MITDYMSSEIAFFLNTFIIAETQGILMNTALMFPELKMLFESLTTFFTKERQSMHIVALEDIMDADLMFLETVVS